MKELLLRCCFLLAILGAFPHLSFGVKVMNYVHHEKDSGTIVEQSYDPYRLFAEERQPRSYESVISNRGSQRVSSSRPAKSSPTHGGKQSRIAGGNAKSYSLRLIYQLFKQNLSNLDAFFVSPRQYYVIALRHILC